MGMKKAEQRLTALTARGGPGAFWERGRCGLVFWGAVRPQWTVEGWARL